jgi:hypothetical protein
MVNAPHLHMYKLSRVGKPAYLTFIFLCRFVGKSDRHNSIHIPHDPKDLPYDWAKQIS